MRLKSINVFSEYLGEENKTKERTGELRKDSEFLDYTFCKQIKYVDNDIFKQLNISCSPTVKNINVECPLVDGYPVINLPFDYNKYCELDYNDKKAFWIDSIAEILLFLKPVMNCKNERIEIYINQLRELSENEIKEIEDKIRRTR